MLKGNNISANLMPLRVFIGGTFKETHEREQAKRILLSLYELYGDAKEWCAIFLDIEIPSKGEDGRIFKRQLDALVIKGDKAIILELKDFDGKIEADLGNDNEDIPEKWIITSIREEPYLIEKEKMLPFRQVRKHKGKVVDLLGDVLNDPNGHKISISDILTFIVGFVVVRDDSEIFINNYDKRKQKWFKIIKEEDIPENLSIQTCRNIRVEQDILNEISKQVQVPKFPDKKVRELSRVDERRIKYWYLEFEGS